MGKRCSFGRRGRRVPRDPDGEDRIPSLIVCEAFFRALPASADFNQSGCVIGGSVETHL